MLNGLGNCTAGQAAPTQPECYRVCRTADVVLVLGKHETRDTQFTNVTQRAQGSEGCVGLLSSTSSISSVNENPTGHVLVWLVCRQALAENRHVVPCVANDNVRQRTHAHTIAIHFTGAYPGRVW